MFEGSDEGTFEGTCEGSVEGTREGMFEGTNEGTFEGSDEGTIEGWGEAEGMFEGSDEGTFEGWGEAEGESEGTTEGMDFADFAALGDFCEPSDLLFLSNLCVAGVASAPLTRKVTKARVRRVAREENIMMKENNTR
jgi:hypothetical protein